MRQVGVFDGKTQFSALIDAAERGETTVITKRGKPVAKIVPIQDAVSEAIDTFRRAALRIEPGESKARLLRELIDEGRRR